MRDEIVASRVEGFTGTDEHWVADPASTTLLQDAYWDPRGGWEICGGTQKILLDSQGVSPFAGGGKINSLFWFSQHNGGTQFLLWEAGASLRVFDGSNRSWIVLATGRYTSSQPWQRSQYAAMGNNVWIVNGEDTPIRFDGRNVFTAGFSAPAPSPVVEGPNDGFMVGTSYGNLGLGTAMVGSNSGASATDIYANGGKDGGGDYSGLLCDVNAYGTLSPPSPVTANVAWRILAAKTDDTQPKYFIKVQVPQSTNDGTVGRIWFRSHNNFGIGTQDGTRLFQAATLPGTAETAFVDYRPDTVLGTELVPEEVGPWPRGAKYIAFFKGRMYLAGMPDDPDIVVYSRTDMVECFPALNYFRIGDKDSGEVTGFYSARNSLWVFKRRGIHIITVEQSGQLAQRVVTKDCGCASPNSIREVPGIGLVFCSDDGVWALTGSIQDGDNAVAWKKISHQLSDYWFWHVNRAALLNACGEVYHADQEYWLSVPIDGQPDNRMVLVYHYAVGAWSFRPDMNAACLAETHDHRGYLFLGSNSAVGHPGVHVYSHGFTTKDGTAKSFRLTSAVLDLGGVYGHVQVTSVRVRLLTYGTNDLSLTGYKDRLPTAIGDGAQTRDQIDEDYRDATTPLPLWGAATWDATGTWMRAVPTATVWNLDTKATKEFQYSLSTTARTQILGAEVMIAGGSKRRVDLINPLLGTGSAP